MLLISTPCAFPALLLAVDSVDEVGLFSVDVVDTLALLSEVVVDPVDDAPLLLSSEVVVDPVDDAPLLLSSEEDDAPLAYKIAEAGKSIGIIIKRTNKLVIGFIGAMDVTYL